jgi:Domain of unknown function (DUF4352)
VPAFRGALTLAALSLALAGCGLVDVIKPPTPAEILARPANSGLRAVKFNIVTHGTNRLSVTGKGAIEFRPKFASDVVFTGGLHEEKIDIDGKMYTRGSLGGWSVEPSKGQIRYGSWTDGKDPKLVGEDTIRGDKAWHVTATDAAGKFDLWVRKSDGYPLRYRSEFLSVLGLEMTFSSYNSNVTIAPPPVPARPKTAHVSVGEAARLNFVAVTVAEVDARWAVSNSFEQPSKGSHFVAIELLYQATGHEKVMYNQFDWQLTSSTGARFLPGYAPREPQLRSGQLQPGQQIRGWIVFQIPDGAAGLSLNGSIGNDKVLVGL